MDVYEFKDSLVSKMSSRPVTVHRDTLSPTTTATKTTELVMGVYTYNLLKCRKEQGIPSYTASLRLAWAT